MTYLQFFLSQRGKPKVGYNGFSYNKKVEMDGSIEWRCDNRSCPGQLFTIDNHARLARPHNHESDYSALDVAILKSKIKERALTTKEKPKP